MTFGIGLQPAADRIDRGLLANAGQHVLQRTPLRMMIEHLIGREQRHLDGRCQARELRQPAPVIATIDQAGGEPDTIGAARLQARQHVPDLRLIDAMRRHQHQELAFGEIQEIREGQLAGALLDPVAVVAALAAGEQLTQPAVGGAVMRIDQNIGGAAGEDDARAVQQPRLIRQVLVVELGIGAHDAGQRVVIGDADRLQPIKRGLVHIVLRMRAAAQEGEIGGDADLDIIDAHANSPCMYQAGCTGLPVFGSISRS
jgi:hypothetical protein